MRSGTKAARRGSQRENYNASAELKRHVHNRELTLSARSITSLFGISLFSIACGPSESDFTEFTTYKSPDGSYFVIIDSAHSKLAFGPETIRMYVVKKDNRERNHIVSTKIANDGGGINDSNVRVQWTQSDVIKFCLSGVEQKDRVLEINVRKLSYTEKEENCS